jgi:hypothetical protein
MKQKIHDLALAAGGSHYPTVGGTTLEKFAELLIEECIQVVKDTPLHCAKTTFQEGIVKCTIDQSVAALRKHFE